ncbi:MAG: hypothetical protein ACR2OI_06635 [Acidimicrobiia bacterium]
MHSLNRDEAGVAVITVTLVGVAVAGIVAVLAVNTMRNYREAQQERQYDEVLVLAESGLDEAVFQLNADDSYTTAPTMPTGLSEQAEKDWAIAQARTLPAVSNGNGEYVIVKPDGSDVVYAVAFSSDQADLAAITRVLQAQLEVTPPKPPYPYIPNTGFASNGSLAIGNSPHAGISGTVGGAQANGILSKGGNPTMTGCTSGYVANDFAGDNPDGCPPGVGERVSIPAVEPLNFHSLAMYDLCNEGSGGVVKAGPALGGADAESPCTGVVLGTPGDYGWSRSGTNWSYQGGIGVFYVNGADEVSIATSSGTGASGASIIVASFNETSVSCNDSGVANVNGGDIVINGNRQLHPHSSMGDLVLVAGRDVTLRGTSDIHGVILAREQVSIGGTPGANNAVVSSSPCNTPTSPNANNEIFGSGHVTYNGGLQAPNYGVGSGNSTVTIDRWAEL